MNKETKTVDKKVEAESSQVNESFRIAIAQKKGFKRKPFHWAKKSGKIIRLDLRNSKRH